MVVVVLPKPDELFDRDDEWSELSRFATNDAMGATLALVYGRRRQGKTLLLELLTESTGGFLATGLEQSSAMNLASLGTAYAEYARLGAPVSFGSWEHAIDALLALGERDAPTPVVLDEFPYLVATAPELPSIIQSALSPRGQARRRSRARMVLCGSAFSMMRNLLGGTAALRGRAPREVVVHPFGYRESAEFWDLRGQWELAVRVHALCGGTPAYLDYCAGDVPDGLADFDEWVVRNLLNPASAFFREGRVLVSEEPDLRDVSLYFSVLTALAAGHTRRSQLAAALGRKEGALAHPLTVLEEARLVAAQQDALRSRRTTFRVVEPMLRFHQLVVAPRESRLSRGRRRQIWDELSGTVSSRILGPHFEELARQWTREHASPRTIGGIASLVGPTVLHSPADRSTHELDVVVVEDEAERPRRVCAIGEAKWRADPMGRAQLERLRRLRTLLPAQEQPPRLLLFSRAGFEPELRREAAADPETELVDLERLYVGD